MLLVGQQHDVRCVPTIGSTSRLSRIPSAAAIIDMRRKGGAACRLILEQNEYCECGEEFVSMPAPRHPKVYHIVHIDRLPSIVSDGCLWCDAERSRTDGTLTNC
jgi:hypothetical protein